MDVNPPAAKKQKTSAKSCASSSAGAAGAVDLEAHCRALEMQNANLKEQLAVAQQQLKEATTNSGLVAEGTAKKNQAPTILEELVYSAEQHTNFLRKARRAPSIKVLDISALVRTTDSYAARAFGLMAIWGGKKPQWRSDKKVDAVLRALTESTDKVERLDVGDARWATEDKYAKDFVKLLRKYKKSVTSVRITMRALVQTSGSGSSQANVIDIFGAMPNLAKLELVVDGVNNHYSAYGGEFQMERMVLGNKRPKTSFAKVKEIELYLTRDWFQQQFGGVDSNCSGDDFYSCYESIGGGYHETEDDRVPDLLEHRKDVITHLDFTDFRKTRVRLPIEDKFAALTKMRSIALRSEFLHIIKDMTDLKEMELQVVGGADAATVEMLSSVLGQLQVLEVQVGPGAAAAQADALVQQVARLCSGRQQMSLVGAGWRDAAVSCMLQSGSSQLQAVRLAKCAGVQAHHLPLLTSLPHLQEVSLPQRLRGALQPEMLPRSSTVKLQWE